jgi:hypothetical protein
MRMHDSWAEIQAQYLPDAKQEQYWCPTRAFHLDQHY